jgi:hypothetical protein
VVAPPPAAEPPAEPEPPAAAPVDPEIARAQRELAQGRPEVALQIFEERLEETPDDADAKAGRESALEAIGSRRSFATGETRVTAAPASGSGSAPAGFALDDVEVASEAPPARVAFEMRPAGVSPGAAWRMSIFLTNDGDQRISVASVSARIRENGQRKAIAPVLRAQRVEGGRRAQVGELAGAWDASVDDWSAEVTVITDEGVRYVGELTWE